MAVTRRQFVQRCSLSAVGAAAMWGSPGLRLFPNTLNAELAEHHDRGYRVHPLDTPLTPQELARRAVDAARAAGADYADVRLTRVRERTFEALAHQFNTPEERDYFAVGVRALVNGVWGFVASPYWTVDEMATLGRSAAQQARSNGLGRRGGVELAAAPAVTGSWVMPVKYDPFEMSIDEQLDYITSIHDAAHQASRIAYPRTSLTLVRQDKTFASTDGSLISQTLYTTVGTFVVSLPIDSRNPNNGSAAMEGLSPAGRGWEHYRDAGLFDAIPALIAEADEARRRPILPPELGRYEVVFDAAATAILLDNTIGAATELDRALGMEANASGTSYLTDPLTMLGTTTIGAPLLTITADRSHPGGAATVKWDDDGVEPNTATLVKDGILTDFQTTREQAAWLAPWYQKRNMPIQSHGYAASPSAMFTPIQHTPNLAMQPATADVTFDALVADLKNGFAIKGGRTQVEQQRLNGAGEGAVFRVRNGKIMGLVDNVSYLFRAPELWSSVRAIGGLSSLRWIGTSRVKGQPLQGTFHSVAAVPMRVSDLRLIERGRRS